MSKKANVSLNEIMGKHGDRFEKEGIEFHHLKELLGEQAPKLEFHALGRLRLQNALKRRFGPAYRQVPGIDKLMQRFDEAAKWEIHAHQMKQKYGRK